MPLYQYRCKACEKITEEFAPMNAIPKYGKCEHCGAPTERWLGAAHVYIWNWNPMELNAEKDMERAERINKGRLYREDQDKRFVNHLANISEV